MTSTAAAATVDASSATWRLVSYRDLFSPSGSAVATEWDAFVSAGVPHLRSGLLAAAHHGRVVHDLTCVLVYRDHEPAAAAVFFSLPVDSVAEAPAWVQRLVGWVRGHAPGFLWKSMRVCGTPLSSSASGLHFSPALSLADRQRALELIAERFVADARDNQTIYFRDLPQAHADELGEVLERQGFFRVAPPPGMLLDLPWKSFDEYLAALRKRYRKRIRDDLKASGKLQFALLDSFAELAPVAVRLYQNVLANADQTLEVLNEAFFAAISRYDQAKLLVAKSPESSEVLGINLLLFAPEEMHNLYIGFDYARNEEHNLYFSLVHHSLRLAIEHGCRRCHLGQDSYEFKARLGAKPYPLAGYMKHKSWPIHWMLHRNAQNIFPPTAAATHDVFQSESGED